MENKKLEVGEEYLNVKIEVGGIIYRFPAFKNKNKVNPKEPEYKGNNIAIWVTSKKDSKDKDVEVDDI
ncbi:MAG TPA: hypothetical protein PLT65_04300 [Bacilli bacterium]|nr:hypothetical protein [Bacilli bacterium]